MRSALSFLIIHIIETEDSLIGNETNIPKSLTIGISYVPVWREIYTVIREVLIAGNFDCVILPLKSQNRYK